MIAPWMRDPDHRAALRANAPSLDHGEAPLASLDASGRVDALVRARSQGLPSLDASGALPPGLYRPTWDTFRERFGTNPRREALLGQLQAAMPDLARAGIRDVIVGGSLVTAKPEPGDVDVAWVHNAGVPAQRRFASSLAEHVRRTTPQVDMHRADALVSNASELGRPQGTTFAELFSAGRDGAARGAVLLPTQLPGAPLTRVDPGLVKVLRGLRPMVG